MNRLPTPRLSGALGALVLGSSLVMSANVQAGCGAEDYIGSVCLTAANYCPRGFLEAGGQLVPVASNNALFSLLGTTYGGDGVNTFALPDLRGRTPVGVGHGPGMSAVTQGMARGNESTTMTIANMAQHNHSAVLQSANVSIPVSSHTQGNTTAPDDTHTYLAASGGGGGSATIWADTLDTASSLRGDADGGRVTVGSAGMSQPFSNLPPQLGLRYCIATTGIYPSRN